MRRIFLSILLLLFVVVDSEAQNIGPPIANKIPKQLSKHGDVRVDEYYWLRERENPEVIGYLSAENVYTQQMMSDTTDLQEELFEETIGRIKQDDTSVPYSDRGYVYYSKTKEGSQYRIYCRKKDETDAAEEIMLDVNKLAEGQPYCGVRGLTVSDDNRLLVYGLDTVGRRKYTLRFKDLETGELLEDQIKDVTGSVVWAADNKTVFYTRQDPQTLRRDRVFRHRLGDDPKTDQIVFFENDEEFNVGIFRSRSRKYIFIESSQTLSSETSYIDANNPNGPLLLFQKREPNHEYEVDHLNGSFFIRTNWMANNFRLMKTAENRTSKNAWQELVGQSDESYFSDFVLFNDWLVQERREDGQEVILVRNWESGEEHRLDFGEPCYSASTSPTPDASTDNLRYYFSSLKTPGSTIEYNMQSRDKQLLKQDEIGGGFNPDNYITERVWVEVDPGVRMPMSIIYHKDTKKDGSAPCLLYGYGSYGASMSASFSSVRFNLVDRGFIYAIAHIRGGQEMGRKWYEDGKLLKKINTFTDFIDAGKYLVENKYTKSERLYARGGSAGGLLVGAVANMAPDLFDGIVADVPFVDVVTTMLDESIPLTTSEYDEWGNPNDQQYYHYMLSYSPYDQVEAKAYPNMLVTTGLHDSQVQYWEPAKWVARLRDRKTDNNQLIFKINMDAGHGGASGRYDRYKEIAFRHAWLLKMAGAKK